jgi:putative Mg2+ transporter-C (MgtC) family protein
MSLTSNPDIWHIDNLELTIRLVLAIVLGGLIGLERELGGHSAGFRTHILVCLGSASIMVLSMYGFSQYAAEPNVRIDPARLAAQVISGIGFLGAGTILRNGMTISGLTTAASLWVVAAIGLSAGAGFYYGASISTLMVVVSLFFLNKVEKNFSRTKKDREITFMLQRKTTSLQQIVTRLNHHGIQIYKLMIENDEAGESSAEPIIIRVKVKLKKVKAFDAALLEIARIEGVIRLETAGDAL